jgi:hypothetical protein
MANDITTPNGVIATDELPGGAHAQLVKLYGGVEDGAERIPGTTANGLLVQLSGALAAIAVTGPVTLAQLLANTLIVKRPSGATATRSSVASSTSTVTLFAANANRLSCQLVNESTARLIGAYGSGASLTSYTFRVEPGYTWEKPDDGYTGIITAVWEAVNGNARCTEVTP